MLMLLSQVKDAAEQPGWTTQAAAAAAVVTMAGMFIWYLIKRDERDERSDTARRDVLIKLTMSLDKNTEALGRVDTWADRMERFLDSRDA